MALSYYLQRRAMRAACGQLPRFPFPPSYMRMLLQNAGKGSARLAAVKARDPSPLAGGLSGGQQEYRADSTKGAR